MINYEAEAQIHNAIILELTIRTLERDKKYLGTLKTNFAIKAWIEQKLPYSFGWSFFICAK